MHFVAKSGEFVWNPIKFRFDLGSTIAKMFECFRFKSICLGNFDGIRKQNNRSGGLFIRILDDLVEASRRHLS